MIYIQVSENIAPVRDETSIGHDILTQTARSALDVAGVSGEVDLTVLLSDDAQIQALNRQYRDVDAATDVLAFPAGDTDPDSQALYLGDVIISYPQAARQATAAGHALTAELQLLTVHGVLHLLGHDHAAAKEKAEMWALQAEALAQLDNPILPDEA